RQLGGERRLGRERWLELARQLVQLGLGGDREGGQGGVALLGGLVLARREPLRLRRRPLVQLLERRVERVLVGGDVLAHVGDRRVDELPAPLLGLLEAQRRRLARAQVHDRVVAQQRLH